MTHSWRHFRDVILTLARRDFAGRYRNTVVGVAWSLITPLLFVLVFYFLFEIILNISIEKYASFVYIGILAWTWFQSSVAEGVVAITSNCNLVSQPGFPVASLPIVAVSTNLFNLIVALPVLLVLLLVEGTRPSLTMFWLPAILLVQYVLILSVCFFVAAINVAIRDVQYIVPVILQVGYYLTPIFYSGEKIPEQYRLILRANPMFGLVESYRDALVNERSPDLQVLAGTLVVSLMVLWLATKYFRRASYRFLEDL